MDRRYFFRAASLAAASTVLPNRLLACLTCHDFDTTDDGYKSSVIDCSVPMNCFVVLGRRDLSYLDAMHPGFFWERGPSSFRVTEVLSYSPAAVMGLVEPGDRVLSINGFGTRFHSTDYQWNPGGAHQDNCLLKMERAGRVREIQLKLRTVRSLLNEAWSSNYEGAHLARGLDWSPAPESGGIEGAYTAGIKWLARDSFIEVSDVIVGSPAHRAGLQLGDRITRFDGSSRLDQTVEELLPGPRPATVRVAIGRDDQRRIAAIERIGLSRLLHSVARSERPGSAPLSLGL